MVPIGLPGAGTSATFTLLNVQKLQILKPQQGNLQMHQCNNQAFLIQSTATMKMTTTQ